MGATVKAGLNGCFRNMGDIMVDANGVFDIVNYVAMRSGSKYVVGREGLNGNEQTDVLMWSTSIWY